MSATTLTSKGQLTLPKEIRQKLGLKVGDRFTCWVDGDDEVVLRLKTQEVGDLVGLLHSPGKKASLEDMDEAVGSAAVDRALRGLSKS